MRFALTCYGHIDLAAPAFGYDEARIRNWLAGRFDQNDWVTESDISALQTASLILDRIESRCAVAISATN